MDNEEQFLKARWPILRTVDGRVTLVNWEQFLKASSAIAVTG
jgi:hypothetical protein